MPLSCKYAIYVKEGLDQYLKCSKSSTYCKYQRFCHTRKKAVNTEEYEKCKFLQAEEETRMANKKKKPTNIKKENVIEEPVTVINEGEENLQGENVFEEEKISATEPKKEEAIVILATANYYIAQKNGYNCKIVEKNNYKKGDIVEI